MPRASETSRIDRLIRALRDEGIQVERDVAVGGSATDAFVSSPDGPNAVIEFKAWIPSESNVDRAQLIAEYLKSSSGADAAFVFLPDLERSHPSSGVFSSDAPLDFVDYFTSLQRPDRPKRKPRVRKQPKTTVFAAMPFQEKYDDTFFVAIQPAALASGATAQRIDYAQFSGDIVQHISSSIRKCRVVVADLSDSRPNVLYELGLAHGLGRPVIQISSSPIDQLPFDVRNNKTIEYAIGQTSSLLPKLKKALKAELKDK